VSNARSRNKRNVRASARSRGRVRRADISQKTAIPGESASLLLSRAMEDRRQTFFRQLLRVRRRASEPAIHDLRVALRRLIAALNLAVVVIPGTGIPRVRRSLRRALKQFNMLRDVHIALLAMKSLRRTSPPVRTYAASLRLKERTLLRECAAYLRSMDVQTLERELAAVQQALLLMSDDPVLDAAAGTMLKGSLAQAVARAVRLERAVIASDAGSIHRLRVAFKKVRYAVEILAPLLPWMKRSRRKWMQEYQTLMGEIQDTEVMLAGVRRFAARPAQRNRISVLPLLEILARQKHERVEAFMQRARELEGFWGEGAAA
jgi:CHAD domain-containing protein